MTTTDLDSTDKPPPIYDDFSRRIWRTRGARLAAYTRLKRQAWWSNFAISLLSVYSIALSVAPLYSDLKSALPEALGFVSVMISIFLIVLAQSEGAKNHMFIAEMMHKCALQLGRLSDEYIVALRSNSLTNEDRLRFTNKYNDILESAQFNHEEIDFDLFRAQHRSDDPTMRWIDANFLKGKAFILAYGFYLVLIAVVPLAVALVWAAKN